MGAVHDLLLGVKRLFAGGPYTIYIWALVIMMILGSIRGCSYLSQGNEEETPRYEQESPDTTDNTKDSAPESIR
jgi:hypothetical protein